jgi:hypothetical protein
MKIICKSQHTVLVQQTLIMKKLKKLELQNQS